jgi:hypothetical protein
VRLAGVVLLFVGLALGVVGLFSGLNSLFSWNGRHAVAVHPIEEESTRHELVPVAGRRYTLSVEVAFDREGLPRRDNAVVVEAKLPLVVRVKDRSGTSLAETTGWLDPNEPPNVLYGQSARDRTTTGRPLETARVAELVALRLVGPFLAASSDPLTIDVELGADRVGAAAISARRLVVHDDALPPSIRNAFLGSGGGGLVFAAGLALLVTGWRRRRRSRGGGRSIRPAASSPVS